MVGRSWRDLERKIPAPEQPPEPARTPAQAVLHEAPQLDALLRQRAELEERMQTLIAGTDGHRDARDAVRFPVTGLPERRAEYRRWETAHDRDRPRTAQSQPAVARAPSPHEQIARWFARRDAQNARSADGARDRHADAQATQQRLDARTDHARHQAMLRRASEPMAPPDLAERTAQDAPSDPPLERPSTTSSEPSPAEVLRRRREEREAFNRPPPRAERAEDVRRKARRGPSVTELMDARPRKPARDDPPPRPRRPTPDEPQPRQRGTRDREDESERLDARLERARERAIGRDSEVGRATSRLDDLGRRAEGLSGKLKDLDRQLAERGLDEERAELRNSPLGKLEKALDKGTGILRRPQRAVDRANAEWDKRRDQISGILPVDNSFRDRSARLLGVDTGSVEDLEARMNRMRERAMRRRTAEAEQERRDERRRERARQRAEERKAERDRER